jgi:cytochrome c553
MTASKRRSRPRKRGLRCAPEPFFAGALEESSTEEIDMGVLCSRRLRQAATAVLAGLASLASMAGAQAAGDAAAGSKKIAQCQVCHGRDGKSKIPEAPNLAGQNEQYLAKALGDYKSGARKNDMMSLVAPNLSDQDIADLAAYYSSIQVTVTPPAK